MDLYDEMQSLIDLKQKIIDDEINLPFKLYGMKYE
jgi:hypothetical protein